MWNPYSHQLSNAIAERLAHDIEIIEQLNWPYTSGKKPTCSGTTRIGNGMPGNVTTEFRWRLYL